MREHAKSPKGAEAKASQGSGSSHVRADQSSDGFEREAETLAERVLRPGQAELQPEPTRPRHEPRLETSVGGGRPLRESEREFFEPRFQADFGSIRVHSDAEAGRTTRRIGARAFTTGRDIAFGPGQYRPGTAPGRRLLAHELVHTLQQDRSAQRVGTIDTPTGPPPVQRSAIAHFEGAGFEEQSSVKRDAFEETLYSKGRKREREKRRFEGRLEDLDPEKHSQQEAELEQKFAHRPGKLRRKKKQLERRRSRAERQLGKLPDFKHVLVIQATYHYVKSHTLDTGELYTMDESALEATRKKFRVGQIWPNLLWRGTKIGVRFDIRFQPHETMAEVEKITGETPGDVPMVGAPLVAAGARVGRYDFTQDPPVRPPNRADTLGQGSYKGVEIDTEAMRGERTEATFFGRDSDPATGKSAKTETFRPQGPELDKYMASVIAHEIGHNIGMIHRDVGIMANQMSGVHQEREEVPDVSPSGTGTDVITTIRVNYPDNPVTEANVQLLVDRIPQMTQKKRIYWHEEVPGDAKLEDSGFTVLQPGPEDPAAEAAEE